MSVPVSILRSLVLSLLLPLSLAAGAEPRPLTVSDDAWRAAALRDLGPMLRACLPRADQAALARLPQAKGVVGDLDTSNILQEPTTIGQGYWYRTGWRAKDGAVFIVALRSPDGQRTVFGPVAGDWPCLPADVRRELGGR